MHIGETSHPLWDGHLGCNKKLIISEGMAIGHHRLGQTALEEVLEQNTHSRHHEHRITQMRDIKPDNPRDDETTYQNWTSKPTAEAQQKDCRIAEDAALSRLRPIPEGPDQWSLCRRSTDTGGTSQGADSTGSAAGLGLTDTCVTGGHPSQTQVAIFSPLRRFSAVGPDGWATTIRALTTLRG
jgi:hypothetical protein